MSGTGCKNYQKTFSRRSWVGSRLGAICVPVALQSSVMSQIVGQVPRDTAIIQYWLNGAASHFETFDPKPDAPSGIRGPFKRIATNVPGVHICESLPLHARLMDKVTLIRSMHHDNSDHQHGMHWCQTGHDAKAHGVNPFKRSSHPSSGSIVSMLRGPNHPGMPPYVLIGLSLIHI